MCWLRLQTVKVSTAVHIYSIPHIYPTLWIYIPTDTHVMQLLQPETPLSSAHPHIQYMHIAHAFFKASAVHVPEPGRRRQTGRAIERRREGRREECVSREEGEFSSELLNVDFKPTPSRSAHF